MSGYFSEVVLIGDSMAAGTSGPACQPSGAVSLERWIVALSPTIYRKSHTSTLTKCFAGLGEHCHASESAGDHLTTTPFAPDVEAIVPARVYEWFIMLAIP